MTTSCPNCGVAYDGFDDCCALKCSSCDTNFCAYCRKQHLTNLQNHNHILECEFNLHNQGEYFTDDVSTVNDAYVKYMFDKLIDAYLMYKESISKASDKEIMEEENVVEEEKLSDKYFLYGAIGGCLLGACIGIALILRK